MSRNIGIEVSNDGIHWRPYPYGSEDTDFRFVQRRERMTLEELRNSVYFIDENNMALTPNPRPIENARQDLGEEIANIETILPEPPNVESFSNIVAGTASPYFYISNASSSLWGSSIQNNTLNTNEGIVLGKKEKRKIPKLKKNASEKEIAIAISNHSEKQTKKIIDRHQTIAAQVIQNEKTIKELQKYTKKQENERRFYANQIAKFAKSKPKLQQQFLREIEAVKKLLQVKNITIDTEGRIIVTTIPLCVIKEGWNTARIIGQFQIQIDFSQNNYEQGIRALNITQRYGCYDSPTIQNATCCWGNVSNDISREFMSQSILELVEDMIDYCSSPNEQHGFLGRPPDDPGPKNGWDIWFSDLTKWPKNYNFEKYEKDNSQHDEELPDRQTIILQNQVVAPGTFRQEYPSHVLEETIAHTRLAVSRNLEDEYGVELRNAIIALGITREETILEIRYQLRNGSDRYLSDITLRRDRLDPDLFTISGHRRNYGQMEANVVSMSVIRNLVSQEVQQQFEQQNYDELEASIYMDSSRLLRSEDELQTTISNNEGISLTETNLANITNQALNTFIQADTENQIARVAAARIETERELIEHQQTFRRAGRSDLAEVLGASETNVPTSGGLPIVDERDVVDEE